MLVERYDTVDRIISNIIIPISREAVTYKGTTYEPRKLRISPSIFRSLQCPEMCGGCCWKSVTLDWFPHETAHENAAERSVTVNDKDYTFLSIVSENTDAPCQFLDEKGRCKIYTQRPFLCDFSFIRVLDKTTHRTMMNATPSRGFHLKRVDGLKGNMCYMEPIDPETLAHRLEQFESLKAIAEYLEIDTHIDDIINHIKRGPTDMVLDLSVTAPTRVIDFIGEEEV